MYTQCYTMYLPRCIFLYRFGEIIVYIYIYIDVEKMLIIFILQVYIIYNRRSAVDEIRAEIPYFHSHLSKSVRDKTTVGWHTSVIVSYTRFQTDYIHVYYTPLGKILRTRVDPKCRDVVARRGPTRKQCAYYYIIRSIRRSRCSRRGWDKWTTLCRVRVVVIKKLM